MGHLQDLQELLSDFFRRRSKINGSKSNLMILDDNGLVNHIAHQGVKEQSRGFLREWVAGQDSFAVRSGRSSPRTTASGTAKEYLPNMLMWSWPKGDSRAPSSGRTSYLSILS
jgi:hypothetical protein